MERNHPQAIPLRLLGLHQGLSSYHIGRRHKMKKDKALFLDIMLNNRFVCTLKYMYCPLFAIRYEALIKFVLDKRQSLKGKPFRIMF